jgi:hypothetical protein
MIHLKIGHNNKIIDKNYWLQAGIKWKIADCGISEKKFSKKLFSDFLFNSTKTNFILLSKKREKPDVHLVLSIIKLDERISSCFLEHGNSKK